MQAQWLWHTGSVAPRHVGSSWTHVSCTGRRILNRWTTGKSPYIPLLPPCPMLFMLLPLSVTSVEEGDRWVGCRGGDRKRNKRKGAGSLAAVRLWCFKLFFLDAHVDHGERTPKGVQEKVFLSPLCVIPSVLPWMQVMGLTSPFHSQRNSMKSQDGVTNPTDGGEPYALPFPTLLPCVLQTAPHWHRKRFLTLLCHYMDVL